MVESIYGHPLVMTAVHCPFWQAQYPWPQSRVHERQSASHAPPPTGVCELGMHAAGWQVLSGMQSASVEQLGHVPQSCGQVEQFSRPAVQVPSPQVGGHAPQSLGQVLQVSVPLQTPSPQEAGGHAPQTLGQVLQVSVPLQTPSPQVGGQAPQSRGQVLQVSPPLQAPSPQ